MTGNPELFHTSNSNSSLPKVTLADGSASRVLGSGSVAVTPSISLSNVLSLPHFSFNLLSVSKLTRALNCCVSFYPTHCTFQDLTTKAIIGRGLVADGLYILGSHQPTSIPRSLTCRQQSSLYLLHYRLGHPSVSLLRLLYPEASNLSSFDCESCAYA